MTLWPPPPLHGPTPRLGRARDPDPGPAALSAYVDECQVSAYADIHGISTRHHRGRRLPQRPRHRPARGGCPARPHRRRLEILQGRQRPQAPARWSLASRSPRGSASTKQTVHRKHGKRTGRQIMTRNFAEDADAIMVQAHEHATRLGHLYLGGEHLLLALAAAGQPAGTVLREHGVTPGRAEAEIVRLSGAAGLFGDLDRGALGAAVVGRYRRRARDDRGGSPSAREALTRAARAVYPQAPLVQPCGPPPSLDTTGPSSPSASRHRAGPSSTPAAEAWAPGRHPALRRRGPCTWHPRRQRGAGAPGSIGTRRVRVGLEHRSPGPLPPGKLTGQPPHAPAGCAWSRPSLGCADQ